MIRVMVAAVLAMSLALVANGSAQQAQELRIGLVLPFTGPAGSAYPYPEYSMSVGYGGR